MLLLIVLLLPLVSLLLVVAAVLSSIVTVDLLHIGKDREPNPLALLMCILQLPLWYYTIKTIIIFSSIYLSAMSFLWKGTPSTVNNIHQEQSFVKLKKSSIFPQKKFAFSLFGGIVTPKSVKSLSSAGGNNAPTNNHFYPDFWAVSGIYPGVTDDTISTQPPFFRAVKCAEKDIKKSFSSGGNKCTAHLPRRNSGRTKPAPNEPSKWLTKNIPISLLMTPHLSLKCSSTGSTTEFPKSKRSGWKNGRKPFEQSRCRIGENHCLHSVLAFANRPDRGFYRPCPIINRSFNYA